MPELSDPPEAPEATAGNLVKARELVNAPIILLPTGVRIAHDKNKNEDFECVDCHFWRLDRAGVVDDGETSVSWWRAREQLRGMIGQYVACRPTQQPDNSITLERLSGAAREVAAKEVASLSAPVLAEEPPEDYNDLEEPF